MAFDYTRVFQQSTTTVVNEQGPGIFTYSSADDSIETIMENGYFDPDFMIYTNALPGDFIFASGTDKSSLMMFIEGYYTQNAINNNLTLDTSVSGAITGGPYEITGVKNGSQVILTLPEVLGTVGVTIDTIIFADALPENFRPETTVWNLAYGENAGAPAHILTKINTDGTIVIYSGVGLLGFTVLLGAGTHRQDICYNAAGNGF